MPHQAFVVTALAMTLVVVGACPGQNQKPDVRGDLARPDWPVWYLDRPSKLDTDGIRQPDGPRPTPDQRSPDQRSPDKGRPDQKPSCSCKSNESCYLGVCHLKCTTSPPCYAHSVCANNESCVHVGSEELCLTTPAVVGGICDNEVNWCPNHTGCAMPNGSTTGICAAMCSSPGTICSNGLPCVMDTGGCSFCNPY